MGTTTNSSRPRILIVHPHADLDSHFTMALFLDSLAREEVDVDVLCTTGGGFLSPECFGPNIRLTPVNPDSLYRLVSQDGQVSWKGLLRRLLLYTLRPGRHFESAAGFDPVIFALFKAKKYSLIAGVNPPGIAMADRLNEYARRTLVYLSFEIICDAEVVSKGDERLQRLEKAACERTALVLIQDEERASFFAQEKNFPREKMLLVPVAPPPEDVPRTNYLREQLGIPADRRIVLLCGNLWAGGSREVLGELVTYWPDEFCLVIHLPIELDKRMQMYVKQLTATGRIFFSSRPLVRRDMGRLISSADFGLAPYIPTPESWVSGLNQYHIGYSSSKVAAYAACGLPILARSLPVFEREFPRYHCGKVYRRIANTGALLQEMDREYDRYSQGARRFYNECLNPVPGMREFCRRLLSLL